ncbi:hypothetical protein NQ317_010393 [Molorchus minor]|uniref:DUF1736 domain-containing protein n=1 Tax=Molorchus minor TaxID=1323400 RepID=A0ABQ9J9Z9_9CUCU|nr:hypothetical protein NQ317_010393 [Molorchus minor]
MYYNYMALNNLRKQTRSLLILASALSIILAVRLQTRTPQFSTADNPAARETDLLTRFLTFCYLPVFNFWLLLFPNTLSFDWGMEAVPRITTLRDSRNFLSFAFYFGLAQLLSRHVKALKWTKKICLARDFDKNVSCTVCHHFYDVHSSSCRNTNNNNTTNFQSTYCVCFATNHQLSGKNGRRVNDSVAILLSVAFLALPFLPATNLLFYVGFVVAERVLYLPSAGLCLLLGLSGASLWNNCKRYRFVLTVCLVVVLVAFSVKTIGRNKDWHDEESLYRSAIPINPPKEMDILPRKEAGTLFY